MVKGDTSFHSVNPMYNCTSVPLSSCRAAVKTDSKVCKERFLSFNITGKGLELSLTLT